MNTQSDTLLQEQLESCASIIFTLHRAFDLLDNDKDQLVDLIAREILFSKEDKESFPELATDDPDDGLLYMLSTMPADVHFHDGKGNYNDKYRVNGWYNALNMPPDATVKYCRIALTGGGPSIYVMTSPDDPKPVLKGVWGSSRLTYEPETGRQEEAIEWFHNYFHELERECAPVKA